MSSTDTYRLLIGVSGIGIAVGLGVFLVTSRPNVTPADTTLAPAVYASAERAQIDLSDGMPSEDASRLRAVYDDGAVTGFLDVAYRNGTYVGTGDALFTGYLSAIHEDGALRMLATCVDGQLQGPAVAWYADGATHWSTRFKDGEVVGQFIEYYPSGELKLRAVSGGQSANGGVAVSEITSGTFKDGTYTSRQLGTGRVQFIQSNGKTFFETSGASFETYVGYMLFEDTLLTGQRVVTNDSRTLASR